MNYLDITYSNGITRRKYPNGTKEWYKNDKRHREDDQPAVIWADGTKYWYKNGKLIQ